MGDGEKLSRRTVVRGGSLWLGAWPARAMQNGASPAVRFGLLTDAHYADKPEWRTRYYRESLKKLQEAVGRFRAAAVPFLVELGDLVDAAEDVDTERGWLRQATGALRAGGMDAHYVLGNHCVQTLTKRQFLDEVRSERGHYWFDRSGVRFVVLDACFRKDGVSYDAGNFDWKDTDIPPEQREWLMRALASAPGKAVIFTHQRLDIPGIHSVASAAEVRDILTRSGNVAAVFQGHSHQNDYREVGGVHYCTMRAVVEGSGLESSGYGIVSLYEDGRAVVEGFRAQKSYDVPA
jgi:alkaline phosphatase